MRIFGENPVLQRELLVNLRTTKSFALLFLFQVALAGIVVVAWPADEVLDLSGSAGAGRRLLLADLFFLGNFVLASLIAPAFAAGAFTGEKERKTYEMLLASPLHPAGIVWGKLVAALTHMAVLVFASLPVVMLCLPLGGVSPWEVLAAYVVLFCALILFGMISVACGVRFRRTSASLMVSYLLILPPVVIIVALWHGMRLSGLQRVYTFLSLFPGIVAAIVIPLFFRTAARLLYSPDTGSHGEPVVDPEQETREAVGLVIYRDRFPDRLFAPPIRNTLMPDGINPVYDKEMRSEIFGQGTLMLRVAIFISLSLAVVPMAVCLYIFQQWAPWYICYVLLFNVLVGPVFSAGAVNGERERQTLDLLLTTTITPWQILWGKLLSGFRVSGVLTAFLLWPVVLALFTTRLPMNFPAVVAWLLIVLLTCLTTSVLTLFCSCVFRRSSVSLVVAYLVLVLLYFLPPAANYFVTNWFPADAAVQQLTHSMTASSPFAAAVEFPYFSEELEAGRNPRRLLLYGEPKWLGYRRRDLVFFVWYLVTAVGVNAFLLGTMIWMFRGRWRLACTRG